MADINVVINSKNNEEQEGSLDNQEKEKPIQKTISLKARRTLEGNIMIFDHEELEIIVNPSQMKIICFPKELISEKVYAAQDRLFRFLNKKGICKLGSIRGGNFYGAMECKFDSPVDGDAVQLVLLSISKFLDSERPFYDYLKNFEEEQEKRLTELGPEASTEFEPELHSNMKGSIRPGYIRGPYSLNTLYRL